MDPIKPANPYDARPAGTAVYRLGDSVFKVYYVDIVGRQQPERYEWDRCGRTRESVLEQLAAVPIEGIGAICSFPHITKVFRFAPSAETIMHVRAFATPDFAELDLAREEGYMEYACYAEALITAEEYRYWAQAASVDEYLSQWCEWSQAAVRDAAKLSRHFS
jgi:hypothetical protein